MPEPYSKTIVCLANSYKGGGRCIAGVELDDAGVGAYGAWVRPVSARPGGELTLAERRCTDGNDPAIMDVITIPLAEPRPEGHQQENHVIDSSRSWTRGATVSWSDLQDAVEAVDGPLWVNGYSSSRGENDQVPAANILRLQRSLYLVRPDATTIHVRMEGGYFAPARRRARVSFEVGGTSYKFSVTDPEVQDTYLARGDGDYSLTGALLCLSLAPVFDDGNAYKVAAAVITPDRAGSQKP